jgi:glycerate kinase
MHVVIAPDSFKESLDAIDVSRAIEAGVHDVDPTITCDLLPMADGGEGTVAAMVHATGGKLIERTVTGPLGEPIRATFGVVGNGTTAVIEMASASGLPHVPIDRRDPRRTTTFGTGELIRAAIDLGCTRIVLGIGGSATVDAGVGAMQALGVRFLDRDNNELAFGGGSLARLNRIDRSAIDPRIADAEICVACDVDNPLHGPNGAARVYGPQKGASAGVVDELDRALGHVATIIARDCGTDVADVAGSGAAGGLGAALLAFCGATLQSGSQLVAEIVGLAKRLQHADLCITGEGRLDGQSRCGKVCYRVASIAHTLHVPTIALAGSIGTDAEACVPPLLAYFSIVDCPMTLNDAIRNAAPLLRTSAANVLRVMQMNSRRQ